MKDTFIIRTEWYTSISKLSESEQAIMLRNLFEYHIGNVNQIDLSTLTLQLVWGLIEPNLKRNVENYDKRCETSAKNGVLGGRPPKEAKPKKPKLKPKKPIKTLNDSDSDSDSDIDNKNEIDIYPFPVEFKKQWDRWKVYKKHQHRFEYKTLDSEQLAFNELVKKSEKQDEKAKKIIEQSIAKGWKGFFDLQSATEQNGTLFHMGAIIGNGTNGARISTWQKSEHDEY